MSNKAVSNNPYESPQTSTDVEYIDSYKPKIFTTKGRIGRLRYLAYSMIYNFLVMFLIGIVSSVMMPMLSNGNTGESGVVILLIIGMVYLPVILVFFIAARRRLHDLDHTGWFSLLMIVPVINMMFGLYLLFASGSPQANQYGPPPQTNSVLEIIIGLVAPIVITGILVAIAIPAYQGYVEKAKQAQSVSP